MTTFNCGLERTLEDYTFNSGIKQKFNERVHILIVVLSGILKTAVVAAGGTSAARDCHSTGPVADAAELPSLGALAEEAGEAAGAAAKAAPRLPAVADHRAYPEFPHRHSAALS